MQTPENKFWQFDPPYWFQQLGSSMAGLSEESANKILAQTRLHTHRTSAFRKDLSLFAGQFKSPLMLMLIGAIILSAFLGDRSDALIILFIVLSTSLLSFFQERNAGKVVEKLQALISIKSVVLRSGQEKTVPAEQIVAGDVLLLKAGDIVPADCLVAECNELYANEASLTGETYPVRKETGKVDVETPLAKRTNTLWQGTNVVSGNAKALVIETGEATMFGRLEKSASSSVETSFEAGIRRFGFFLMRITMLLAVFVLVVNLINHKGLLEAAMFSLALAVGMAPELLPAITTISMSAGARRMLEKKVIVKKLNSIQNLGEVNLLCTDKTGTITKGEIEIAGTVDGKGVEDAFVRQLAFWNAQFETGYVNPIDAALRALNVQVGQAVKIGEIPYDFNRKRLSVAIQNKDEKLLICKGAFLNIRSICTKIRFNDQSIQELAPYDQALEKRFSEYGEQGLRAIAVCYKPLQGSPADKNEEAQMIFAGFILMQDPIKPSIQVAIERLRNMQVGLKIITGDNFNVAVSIGHQIGIENPKVLTGKEVDQSTPENLALQAQSTDIFAEVEPQQKEHIILALKKHFSVAYMGDGINDVAAINAADVGISVSNAVDVAKEAADFVLTENDLTVLINGIEEGRKTFANTLKYIYINTGSTFGNMFSMAAASLMLPFLPMLPKQILLTNFLTDFPFLAVSSDNVDAAQLQNPGKWDLRQIQHYMVIFGIHSTLFDIGTFVTLFYFLRFQESAFQTGWFIESILTELLILFVIRTRGNFLTSKPGKYLFIISLIALVATLLLPYLPFAAGLGLVPLPLPWLLIILGIVLAYIVTADLLKIWFFKKYP